MKYLLVCTLCFQVFLLPGQSLNDFMVMNYTFDNCAFSDDTGLHDDIIVDNPDCVCGIEDLGVDINSDMQLLQLPKTINSYLSEDFTLSFYFQVRNTGNPVSIWALTKDNSIDSMMSIRYLPLQKLISVQLAESPGTFLEMAASIDTDRCWNHLVLTRESAEYYVYINAELAASARASRPLSFALDTSVYIAANPGMLTNQDIFNGKIDEIQLFNTFAGASQISALYKRPGQILNPDTTLFLGNNLQIEMGPSCAVDIGWSPQDGVSDASIVEPIITPKETTLYTVELKEDFCSDTDAIRLNVIDRNMLDCFNLLLPKAFTPNGDGLNDTYFISNEFIVEQLSSFEIFDRIGQKVFESQDKTGQWDGTYEGALLNPGMFLYKITYTCQGEEFSVANNFSLIR